MRILMLAQFFSPVVGGEERMVEDLGAELVGRGHQVAVATLAHPAAPPFEIRAGVRIHRIATTVSRFDRLYADEERRHHPPAPDPRASRALASVLRSERPDVVHAHNWLVHSYLPRTMRGAPSLVMSLHDYSLVCATKRLMRDGVAPCSGPGVRKCLRCARLLYGPGKGHAIAVAAAASNAFLRSRVKLFLPVSEAVAAGTRLARSGVKYRVVPNFIRHSHVMSRTTPLPNRLPDDPFLLYVGDISRDKGVDVLIEAYGGLSDPPPLVLIGRRHDAGQSVLPRGVTLLGPWPHGAVMEAWRRSMLGVVPSVVPEAFGMAALEAMAVGRPVVAAASGALPEVVGHADGGLLVAPSDVSALRDALAQLIRDDDERRAMGKRARARARRFLSDVVVPEYEDVYGAVTSAER